VYVLPISVFVAVTKILFFIREVYLYLYNKE